MLATGVAATLPQPVVGFPEPSLVVSAGIPLLRWLANVCAIAAVGSWLVLVLLGGDGRERWPTLARRASMVGVWAAATWTAAALSGLWFQAAQLSSAQLRLPVGGVLSYVGHINLGGALLTSIASAGVLTIFSIIRLGRPTCPPALGLLIALPGLIAVPLSGHVSQGSPSWLLMTAMVLHVIGAALWIGGLAISALVISAHRDALAIVLPRFSTVAAVSFVAVGSSGVVLAASRLTGDVTPDPGTVLGALTHSGAGWLLAGKLACLTVLGCSGAYIRMAVIDRVARRIPAPLSAWAGFELVLMAIAVALATAVARPL